MSESDSTPLLSPVTQQSMKNNFILYTILAYALLAGCKGPQQAAKSGQGGGYKLTQSQQVDEVYTFYNANKEKILGNLDNAENLFSQVLRQDINNHAAMYNLADIYLQQKKYSDALYFAKKAYTLDSKNEWYAKLLIELYERTRKFSDAIPVYQKLVKDYPDRVDFYFGLAEEYIYDNKLTDAIKTYDIIESKMGISSEVSMQKERLYVKLGKNDKAIAEVQKLIDSDPDNTHYLGALATLYQAIGQDEKAYDLLNRILTMHPDDPYVHLSLADYYRNKGDKDKSYDELKKAFSNRQLDTETKLSILGSYVQLIPISDEMKIQALELAKLLVESSPTESRVHAVYGDFLSRDKKYEEARKEFREAIKLGTKEFAVYDAINRMNALLNDTNALLKESDETISKFPEQPTPYYFKGVAETYRKDYTKAGEDLNSALKLVVDDTTLEGDIYSALGDAYNYLPNYAKSDENYQKAHDLNPKNQYVMNNWAYYLSLRSEKLDKAEKMSKLSMEIEPNSATFEDTYAWILYRMGRFTEAKEWLEKAFSHGADKSGTSLEHYGDVMFKLGDPEKALEYWQKAKKTGEGSDLLDKKITDKRLYEANGGK